MLQKCRNKLKPEEIDGVNTKIQFQSINFNSEQFDALNTLRINRSQP